MRFVNRTAAVCSGTGSNGRPLGLPALLQNPLPRCGRGASRWSLAAAIGPQSAESRSGGRHAHLPDPVGCRQGRPPVWRALRTARLSVTSAGAKNDLPRSDVRLDPAERGRLRIGKDGTIASSSEVIPDYTLRGPRRKNDPYHQRARQSPDNGSRRRDCDPVALPKGELMGPVSDHWPSYKPREKTHEHPVLRRRIGP